ncbi:MAG TPA: NAD-dependent epimerase/dehydratase family protein [Clostridia bacterium]|nr:NAD-dependent epimerase/dehydratase family protein [Clostridia bacterium]
MKILVTGSNGFIGKNIIAQLNIKDGVEIVSFDKEDSFTKIEENIESIDFIIHLAGINRPKDKSEFYKGNTDLTKNLIDLILRRGLSIPIIISSSIQAVKDNDYGKSKKQAEDILIEYSKSNPTYIYRLHNVFGKWCRPNYNSVVATFCNNIANGLEISVNDTNLNLELVYIDDIVEEFINIIETGNPNKKIGNYCYIEPKYEIKLGELANLIESFKKDTSSLYVPNTGDEFIKKMYATYISYVPIKDLIVDLEKHEDNRGMFTEVIKTNKCGQFSVSISKPGIIRGNHYHHTKMERFIVIKGSARIIFTHIINGESYEINVNDKEIKEVTIPVGYTHSIENTGNEEMILLIWGNELFNQQKPDTIFKEVSNNNINIIKGEN